MSWRLLVIPVLALMLGGAVACGGDDDDDSGDDGGGTSTGGPSGTDGTTIELSARDFSFSESVVTAPPGKEVTVEFTNTGTTAHSFTVDELDVDEELAPGESATITLTMPGGTTKFYCRFHPVTMQGVLEPGEARHQDDGGGSPTSSSSGGDGY